MMFGGHLSLKGLLPTPVVVGQRSQSLHLMHQVTFHPLPLEPIGRTKLGLGLCPITKDSLNQLSRPQRVQCPQLESSRWRGVHPGILGSRQATSKTYEMCESAILPSHCIMVKRWRTQTILGRPARWIFLRVPRRRLLPRATYACSQSWTMCQGRRSLCQEHHRVSGQVCRS